MYFSKTISLIPFVFFILISSSLCSYQPKLIDTISVKYPGFVTFVPSSPELKTYHLAISAFNGAPLSADHIYYIANYTGTSATKKIVELSHTNIVWPNEAAFTSSYIISPDFDQYGGILVPSGFLVPTKENGGLFYYPFMNKDRSIVTDQDPIELTETSQTVTSWFYHR
jgi:hypothetical protein